MVLLLLLIASLGAGNWVEERRGEKEKRGEKLPDDMWYALLLRPSLAVLPEEKTLKRHGH